MTNVIASAIAGLGIVVISGWYAKQPLLVQVIPNFAPMQYNTALCFLLSGLAIISLNVGRKKPAIIFATILTVLAALSGAQYVFTVDFGIDQLFHQPFTSVKTLNPGRMAPATALTFLLTGVAVQLGQSRVRQRIFGVASLGAIILSFGLSTFIGYFTGKDTPYGWQHPTYMAIHTALTFGLAGVCLILWAAEERAANPSGSPRWIPAIIAALVATLAISAWHTLVIRESNQMQQQVSQTLDQIATDIQNLFQGRSKQLIRMAKRWEARGGMTQTEWQADSELYVDYQRGYIAIIRTDKQTDTRWMVRNEAESLSQDVILSEEIYHGLNTIAANATDPFASEPIHPNDIPNVFLLVSPLFVNGGYDGMLIAVAEYDTLLRPLFASSLARHYDILLTDDQAPFFDNRTTEVHLEGLSQTAEISVLNRHWNLTIWPSESLKAGLSSELPKLLLLLGLFIAVVLGLVAHFGMTLVSRSRELEEANKLLGDEVLERKKAENSLIELNDTLEQRVQERTAESEQRAKELQAEVQQRKKTQKELKKTASKLAQESGLLQAVLDNIADGVMAIDFDSKLLAFNTAAKNILQKTPTNVPLTEWTAYYGIFQDDGITPSKPEDFALVRALEGEIINNKTVFIRNGHHGGGIYLDTSASPLKTSADKKIGAVATFRDVTERMMTEKKMQLLLNRLREKNAELEQIIYVTSHDLRSPLVNIQGFSQELSSCCKILDEALRKNGMPSQIKRVIKPILESDIPESLHFIKSSTAKMDTLLKGLLRLSRLGSAAMEIHKLNINELVSTVAGSYEFQISEGGIKLRIDDLHPCHGDEMRVTQVFSNLLGNAIKYRDHQRETVIRISSQEKSEFIEFCVEDNGIGISPRHQKKIFKIFYRLNPTEEPGEGIGLTIVQKILDRHGGRIWLESSPGIGSKFFFSLPMKPFQPLHLN